MRPVRTVFVVITAAATFAATATAGAVAAEAAPAVETEIEWTRVTSPITYTGTALLEGRVKSSTGTVLLGARVQLYSRSSTSRPWSYVTATTSDSSEGLFRFSRKPPQNYYYSVIYRGSDIYESSSAHTRVEVRRKLTPNDVTGTPGGQFAFTGPAKPTSKSAGKPVRLWVKTCSTCSWQTTSSTTTNSSGYWRFAITGPSRPGKTYHYKAYTPATSGFAVGYSSEIQVSTP